MGGCKTRNGTVKDITGRGSESTFGCEIDDHGWQRRGSRFVRYGMAVNMAIRVRYLSGRGRHLAWEESGEIRGLMNRSHNQIALPSSGFRDQTPPSRSASSFAGAGL